MAVQLPIVDERAVVDRQKTIPQMGIERCSILDTFENNLGKQKPGTTVAFLDGDDSLAAAPARSR